MIADVVASGAGELPETNKNRTKLIERPDVVIDTNSLVQVEFGLRNELRGAELRRGCAPLTTVRIEVT